MGSPPSDSTGAEPIYCVDASSLIAFWRRFPDLVLFSGVWDGLVGLCNEGRLVAPREVIVELEAGTDALGAWAKGLKCLSQSTSELWDRAREVTGRFHDLAGAHEPGSVADPWVVALALQIREEQNAGLFRRPCVVVTDERRKGKPERKIPDVCDAYGIDTIDHLGLMRGEGWSLVLG